MFKFLRFVFTAYLLVLVLAALTWLALWKWDGFKLYSVQTNSMAPVLQPGDLAVSIKPQLENLQIGDIISYKSSQNPQIIVTHRIYQLYPDKKYLITKGDNLTQPDPAVAYANVSGKTIRAIPKLGILFNFIHSPLGLVSLLYLPALIASAFELQGIINFFQYQPYQTTQRV